MKIFYRADKRLFKPGDVIPPAKHFIRLSSPSGAAVHQLMKDLMPGAGPDREIYTHVFESFDCALKYFVKMRGAHLYRVSINKVIHRADMHLIDQIERETDKKTRESLANRWYAGDELPNPCIEILSDRVTVIEEINVTRAQRNQAWRAMGVTITSDQTYDINDLVDFDDLK